MRHPVYSYVPPRFFLTKTLFRHPGEKKVTFKYAAIYGLEWKTGVDVPRGGIEVTGSDWCHSGGDSRGLEGVVTLRFVMAG